MLLQQVKNLHTMLYLQQQLLDQLQLVSSGELLSVDIW